MNALVATDGPLINQTFATELKGMLIVANPHDHIVKFELTRVQLEDGAYAFYKFISFPIMGHFIQGCTELANILGSDKNFVFVVRKGARKEVRDQNVWVAWSRPRPHRN